ncbi:MAG: S46 family peptidase [Myxococcales bacterium]
MKRIPSLLLALLVAAPALHADEGMWTYDNFPKEKVRQKYGFAPGDDWLAAARLSSVRLAGGCSGSFVSPDGLVMTNHHCAHSCIEQLSTKEKDFVKSGFTARTAGDEVKCPEIELNQLLQITDVTDKVNAATQGKQGQEYATAQKAALANLEKACANGDDKVRCDVVTLYHGGVYSLYKYRRFQDVRLVFAPEFAIAFFGGDPDNFNFPRYDLDVSFIRAYEDGKPYHPQHYFKFSQAGAKEGDLTFVSGHPGGTDRDLTVAQLSYQRDVALPERLFQLAEYRGALSMFPRRGPEQYRIAEAELFGVENGFKALKGRFEALVDEKLVKEKAAREAALRRTVEANAELKASAGGAWAEIERVENEFKLRRKDYAQIEGGAAFGSKLFRFARLLARAADELPKANETRLKEFRESALPQLRQALFSKAPIYDELEIFRLSYTLTKMRETLGADHPFVRKVLGKKSPDELAQELIAGTKLKDAALRQQLFEKGKQAVDASQDPLVRLARAIDPEARALRKWHDEVIEPRETRATEAIAKARFQVEGKSNYPDATFTLRLSYGAVKGYDENGRRVNPITTFAGAFDRATGRDPFKLPDSWLNAKARLGMGTPFNVATTNDIIGGNSGSPVFNKNLEVVGLIFDGNIQSLGGDYGFDETVNRAVAVESVALTEALDKIYGATRLVQELKPGKHAAGAGQH